MLFLDLLMQNSILGFIIGDVLGMPVEFKSREELKMNPVTDLLENGTYNQPKGTWSDDTSMVLATMQSIIDKNDLDYNDLINKFMEWYQQGKYTPDGKCFDIGNTTRQALEKYYLLKCDSCECGGNKEFDNGNGSLMRMLPIVFYCLVKKLDDKGIYEVVEKTSSLTHRHKTSIFACYLYIIFMIHILKGMYGDKISIYEKFKKYIYEKYPDYDSKFERILKTDITKLKEEDIKSTGYIVDTLEAAIWCFLTTENYKESVLKAVNLGGDTDTIAAITGSMTGTFYQTESLLENEWFMKIKKLEEILNIINKFSEYIYDND